MKARIKSSDHASIGRMSVFNAGTGAWIVASGHRVIGRFPTHAEAITYATEQATRQALAAHFTIPPETEPTC